MTRFALILALLLACRIAAAALQFGEQFPEELRNALRADPRSAAVGEDFMLETADGGFILIVSKEGLMRRLPLEKTSAADILNVIETMQEEITVIREAREKRSEPGAVSASGSESSSPGQAAVVSPPKEEPKPVEEKPKEKEKPAVEWFAFADPDSRFYIGLTLSPEEAGAGGLEFSGGVAFLRFGVNAKKGLNIKLPHAPSLAWEAYGVLAQIDVLRVTEVTFSTGIEVFLYRLNNRIFERDQLFIGVAYKFLFMVVGARAAVSPSTVIIKTEGKSYRTAQVRGVFFFSFAF